MCRHCFSLSLTKPELTWLLQAARNSFLYITSKYLSHGIILGVFGKGGLYMIAPSGLQTGMVERSRALIAAAMLFYAL